MQRTRPSQPKRLFWMVSNIIDIPVLLNSFSFEITFGKKILRIHQRHLVWKTSCFLTDAKEVFYSDPYKRTLRTLLLRILILVWMLPVDLHMDFNIKKSWLVLLILVLVSLSQSPVVVTLILRYVNSSTSSSGLLFTSIWLQLVVFMRRTWVFSVDLQSYFVNCGIELLSLLLDVMVSAGYETKVISIIKVL